jgi:hypothetical protein
MRLGVPFIAPMQLGAVESNPGKQFLPSVAWRTGQSGAPPDTVRCRFLSFSGEADRWRLGAVGALDTVRCPLPTVGLATCLARIAQPSVGPADRWLTGQSGAASRPLARPRVSRRSRSRPLARTTVGSPDSPVNYSRTPLNSSRERPVRLSQPGAPDSPVLLD